MSLISIGEMVVDQDTGELVECPAEAGVGYERIDYFIRQYGFAREQAQQWEMAKGAYSAVMQRLMSESGIGARKDAAGSVTVVPEGVRVTAPADNLAKAHAAELLTESEVVELAIAAAKDLDRPTVEAWIASVEDESRRAALSAVLLNRSPRKPYVIVKPARVAAPEITAIGGAR